MGMWPDGDQFGLFLALLNYAQHILTKISFDLYQVVICINLIVVIIL